MDLLEGDRFEVEVGAPAHGGHCVARHEGRVLFVRHALPGERVIAEVTEVHRGYARADAVDILVASPDRVVAPCPYAHPGGCGGCDLQHAGAGAQLSWKADVLDEQLRRLAKIDFRRVPVEALEGGGFGWRTRVRYRVAANGRAGLLKHRSHEVVPIENCLIAHPSIQVLDVLDHTWPGTDAIDVVAPLAGPARVVQPGSRITERAVGRDFDLDAGGFWQVHPAAAETLARVVVEFLDPRPGERAWDLYGGAGLFSAALARHGCEVTLVEADRASVAAARRSLAGLEVEVVEAAVEHALPSDPRSSSRSRRAGPALGRDRPVDLVVLDPPRTGAGARVVRMIDDAGPRAVAYVACDPAALARDLRTFLDLGWRLAGLRAFDCFPQTHHLEAVALLDRS